MERKLKAITYVMLLCISFLCGFLICDYFTETETVVSLNGGKLYYNDDGSKKDYLERQRIEESEIKKTDIAYKINLNTATKEELADLPYIGEKTAEKIINYREKSPFKSLTDLLNIEGIGQSIYKTIEGYIYIE